MDDEVLIKLAYVDISSYRSRAAKTLKDDVKTPTKIANDTGIRRNHISKVLRELKEAGVAECVNEEAHRGRLYRLTSVGDEIVDELISREQ